MLFCNRVTKENSRISAALPIAADGAQRVKTKPIAAAARGPTAIGNLNPPPKEISIL